MRVGRVSSLPSGGRELLTRSAFFPLKKEMRWAGGFKERTLTDAKRLRVVMPSWACRRREGAVARMIDGARVPMDVAVIGEAGLGGGRLSEALISLYWAVVKCHVGCAAEARQNGGRLKKAREGSPE